MSAQTPMDSKRQHPPQPHSVHPAATWQKIQKYLMPYRQTTKQHHSQAVRLLNSSSTLHFLKQKWYKGIKHSVVSWTPVIFIKWQQKYLLTLNSVSVSATPPPYHWFLHYVASGRGKDHSVTYVFTSRYVFVFMTMVSHSQIVGGAKSHKMWISTEFCSKRSLIKVG